MFKIILYLELSIILHKEYYHENVGHPGICFSLAPKKRAASLSFQPSVPRNDNGNELTSILSRGPCVPFAYHYIAAPFYTDRYMKSIYLYMYLHLSLARAHNARGSLDSTFGCAVQVRSLSPRRSPPFLSLGVTRSSSSIMRSNEREQQGAK